MYRNLWMAGVAIVVAVIAIGTYFYLQSRPVPEPAIVLQTTEEDVYSPEVQALQLKNLKALAASMASEQAQVQQQAQLAALKSLQPGQAQTNQDQLKSLQSLGM